MSTWNDGTMVLMHHGIKGQKWGVRRFQNPDGTYTAEGKARRNNGITTKIKNKWDSLSDRDKTVIKIGAAAVATGLAVYGMYKVGAFKAAAKVGKEVANKIVNSKAGQKVSEIAAKQSASSISKIVKNTQKRQEVISDEILKQTKERLELEADVVKLEKEAMSKGQNWVADAAKSIAKKAAVQLGTTAVIQIAKDWLQKKETEWDKTRFPDPKNQW